MVQDEPRWLSIDQGIMIGCKKILAEQFFCSIVKRKIQYVQPDKIFQMDCFFNGFYV